jgi:hypothetical protein
MIGDIVSQHKRNGLPFAKVDVCNYAFSLHIWLLDLLKDNCRTRFGILLSVVNCHIELELECRGREDNRLALGTPWWMLRKEDLSGVRAYTIFKSWEYLDIWGRGGIISIWFKQTSKPVRTKINGTTNALDTADKPFLQLILHSNSLPERHLFWDFCNYRTILRSREKIDEVNNTLLMNVPSL